MENVQLRDIIKGFLEEYENMTLTTCVNDTPWGATVFFASDDALNLYFISDLRTRHAQDIAANTKVAVVINPNNQEHGKLQGLQLAGEGQMLNGKEVINAFAVYIKRYPTIKSLISSVEKLISGSIRIYRIRPARICFIDEARFGKGARQELILNGE